MTTATTCVWYHAYHDTVHECQGSYAYRALGKIDSILSTARTPGAIWYLGMNHNTTTLHFGGWSSRGQHHRANPPSLPFWMWKSRNKIPIGFTWPTHAIAWQSILLHRRFLFIAALCVCVCVRVCDITHPSSCEACRKPLLNPIMHFRWMYVVSV